MNIYTGLTNKLLGTIDHTERIVKEHILPNTSFLSSEHWSRYSPIRFGHWINFIERHVLTVDNVCASLHAWYLCSNDHPTLACGEKHNWFRQSVELWWQLEFHISYTKITAYVILPYNNYLGLGTWSSMHHDTCDMFLNKKWFSLYDLSFLKVCRWAPVTLCVCVYIYVACIEVSWIE